MIDLNSQSITALFNHMFNEGFVNRLAHDTISFFQDPAFFSLALAKQRRLRKLALTFSRPGKRCVFVSHTLRNLTLDTDLYDVCYLPKGYFSDLTDLDVMKRAAYIECGIVIINNNDSHEKGNANGYVQVFNQSPNTLFVVWDFDNHHWLSLSPALAAHSDVYVPAHMDNHYLLSKYNSAVTDPVAAGVIQWTSSFLATNVGEILHSTRVSTSLGMHIPYSAFSYRSQVIVTLSQKIPSIGFSSHDFHERSDRDRFQEWHGFKSHWIVPVLNDIPIRIFDALVTGGIPIVPESLRFIHPISAIPREHIIFYDADDIMDPERLIIIANKMFDVGGPGNIVQRHRFALDHHHGDQSFRKIMSYVNEKIENIC
jgi:hypothetical protein